MKPLVLSLREDRDEGARKYLALDQAGQRRAT